MLHCIKGSGTFRARIAAPCACMECHADYGPPNEAIPSAVTNDGPLTIAGPVRSVSSAELRAPFGNDEGKKTAADAARLFGVHPATVSRLLRKKLAA
jgi:hypothetical protein